MPIAISRPISRSDQFLKVLSVYDRCLVVMHDNPDPDAIAAGWAVQCLIEDRLGKPTQLVGGGAILRAENRHMLELLSPPVELVTEIAIDNSTAVILVDCGLSATNHLVTRAAIRPTAVIDHHLSKQGDAGLPFNDTRAGVAATASIAASYLREQKFNPGMKLATAILYAIRTETRGSETEHSQLDRAVVAWLTEVADPALLAEIENAPLERDYFGDLVLAIDNTLVYGDAAMCFLRRASGAETVGEVADLLVRCRGVRRVLCVAVVGDDLVMSVRTEKGFDNAVSLLQDTLVNLGGCGGHMHRAGGKIPSVVHRQRLRNDASEELRRRWLRACGVDGKKGQRLVSRPEVVGNL